MVELALLVGQPVHRNWSARGMVLTGVTFCKAFGVGSADRQLHLGGSRRLLLVTRLNLSKSSGGIGASPPHREFRPQISSANFVRDVSKGSLQEGHGLAGSSFHTKDIL
jgi:hypothetical protein